VVADSGVEAGKGTMPVGVTTILEEVISKIMVEVL